jgi:hypothetical protein
MSLETSVDRFLARRGLPGVVLVARPCFDRKAA